jgi:hypothetical protein
VREQELATPAARVAAQEAAARRGEAAKGQGEAGKAAGKVQEGTWHGLERHGGGRCAAHGRRGRRGVGQRGNRAERLEVDEGDLIAIFQKCRDSTVKPR